MSMSSRRLSASVVAGLCIATLGLPAGALAQSPMASQPPGSGAPAQGVLHVEGAWARTSPMMQLAGAAFMVLVNDGSADDALVAASTPVATTVELHQTTADASGVMTMAPVPEVPVPAGGRTELAPGGFHVMLIGLTEPLLDGGMVPLTLTFRSGAVIEVEAVVSAVAPGGSASPMGPGTPQASGMPIASPWM